MLGPGRRRRLFLLPAWWIAERLPPARETAWRPGLVTLPQMVPALVAAVEDPRAAVRVAEVPEVRGIHRETPK